MRNIIDLTRRMSETLSLYALRHANDIIASSPWVQGNGDMPHRIVMRDLSDDWVVHTQVIDVHNNNVSFMWGSYTPKRCGDAGFATLWETFEGRCRRHLGIVD
jgi:hypothetical protein